MAKEYKLKVAGADGCKGGWFVVIASVMNKNNQRAVRCVLKLESLVVVNTFSEVISETTNCKLVCVDIPIGLSDAKPRECDLAARKVLGRLRSSSVFAAPVRACLSANSYNRASEICFECSGKRLNKQGFFLLSKICQVDDLMTPELQRRVREIHPEVSFWALNGKKAMQYSKRSLMGRRERMEALSADFSEIEQIMAKACRAGQAGPDDILDGLVAAWTAGQAVMGKAETLPQRPELDGKGLRMEILCPAG